jgi:hypothetical protein
MKSSSVESVIQFCEATNLIPEGNSIPFILLESAQQHSLGHDPLGNEDPKTHNRRQWNEDSSYAMVGCREEFS